MLIHPPQGEPANVWVEFAVNGGTTQLTLEHDYPDFKPVAGWFVDLDGHRLVIEAVDGRLLHCVAAQG